MAPTSIEYEVRTPVGALVLTTPEQDIAITFVKQNPDRELAVEEVTITHARRRVYPRVIKAVGRERAAA